MSSAKPHRTMALANELALSVEAGSASEAVEIETGIFDFIRYRARSLQIGFELNEVDDEFFTRDGLFVVESDDLSG